MNNNKSTLEEPLRFFQWMFLENGLQQSKSMFFNQFEIYGDLIIKKDDDSITYHGIGYDERKDSQIEVEYTKSFKKELEERLNAELKNTISLVRSAIANMILRGVDIQAYLNSLNKNTQFLRSHAVLLLKQYTYIDGIINKIGLYIEEELNKVNPLNDKTVIDDFLIHYKGNKSNLEKIKNHLIDKGLIDNADDFIKIFLSEPFDKKINWKSYANLFHYFIDQLDEAMRPTILSFDRERKWKVASKIFTIKGEPIDHEDIKGNNKMPADSKKQIINDAIKIINF